MLNTGLQRKTKVPKMVTVLKQDRQAFGSLLSKSVSLEEAFEYPVTSLPLSIANGDVELRQSGKSILRNYLIDESQSVVNVSPKNCRWTIDGMAAMRTLKAKETYKEWITSLLKFVTPLNDPNHCQSKSLMIPIRPRASRVRQGTKEENLLEDSHQKLGSKNGKRKRLAIVLQQH